MKIKELRQKSNLELKRILMDARERLQKNRFDLANKKLKNVREISATKRNIARTLTLLEEEKKQIKTKTNKV